MTSAKYGLWLALVTMATAMPSSLHDALGPRDFHRNQEVTGDGWHDILALLPDELLIEQLAGKTSDEQYTKLERTLVNAVLTFRDRLSKPQPDLGLPAFDPFVFTEGRTIVINNSLASMNATLISVNSEGISQFKVDTLSLYLVERIGVLDITIPGFSVDFVLDLPAGTWVSPLQLPLDDQLNLRFQSPVIKIKTRGKISVKNSRLSMASTALDIDLGDYELQLLSQRPGGWLSRNPGLGDVLTALVKRLTPQLVQDWTPVAEKYLTMRLDEKLQELQLSDLIDPPQ